MAGARRDELERRTRHQPEAVEAPPVRALGARVRLLRRPRKRRRDLRDRAAAAERDRRAAHGPRAERLDPGHADAAAPDARAQHALDLRHRPCVDRRARRDREAAAGGGDDPHRRRPRGVRRARLGVAARDRRHHHPAAEAAGLHARLRPRALHHGRGLRAGGDGDVRAALRQGPDLPRQPHRQLVPGLRLDRVRPGGAPRARRRRALRGALPDHRHRPVPDRGHRAARDDPGRHGRGRAPGRRPLPPPGRQDGDRADRGPRGADHRRRLREDGLRHRRAQGHARPRPQRLRDRAPPRPARDLGDRVRRPHVGGGRRVRRAGRGRGPPEGDRPPVQRAAAARRAALRA